MEFCSSPAWRKQLGNSVQYLGKETSDCKYYLVHSFMRENPQSQQINQRDRMEYFACFSPQAAADSWYLPDEFITTTQERILVPLEQDKDIHPIFSQRNSLLTHILSLYLKEKQFHTQAPAVPISLALLLRVPVKRGVPVNDTLHSTYGLVHLPTNISSHIPRSAEGGKQGWGKWRFIKSVSKLASLKGQRQFSPSGVINH